MSIALVRPIREWLNSCRLIDTPLHIYRTISPSGSLIESQLNSLDGGYSREWNYWSVLDTPLQPNNLIGAPITGKVLKPSAWWSKSSSYYEEVRWGAELTSWLQKHSNYDEVWSKFVGFYSTTLGLIFWNTRRIRLIEKNMLCLDCRPLAHARWGIDLSRVIDTNKDAPRKLTENITPRYIIAGGKIWRRS